MFVSWLYLLVQQATRYRKWRFFGLYTFRPPATSALDRKMHIIMETTWQPMKPIPTSLLPLLSVPFYTRFDTNTKFGFVHCQVPGDVSFETNVLSLSIATLLNALVSRHIHIAGVVHSHGPRVLSYWKAQLYWLACMESRILVWTSYHITYEFIKVDICSWSWLYR